jgi:hypothetical protein
MLQKSQACWAKNIHRVEIRTIPGHGTALEKTSCRSGKVMKLDRTTETINRDPEKVNH